MMTSPNPAMWTELETRRDALHRKLQLLNQFIELRHQDGTMSWAVAESLLAEIEAAQGDSTKLATATENCRAAAAGKGSVSE